MFVCLQPIQAAGLFAAETQQLHPEADTQYRLSTRFNSVDQFTCAQLTHSGLRRADAVQNEFVSV